MNKNKDAYMTLELASGIVAIIIPFLLFLSEVYRFEYRVQKMVFSGQHKCLETAFIENKEYSDMPQPKKIPIPLFDDIELMAFTKRYFKANWQPTVQHVEKTYRIYTGTGKDGS